MSAVTRVKHFGFAMKTDIYQWRNGKDSLRQLWMTNAAQSDIVLRQFAPYLRNPPAFVAEFKDVFKLRIEFADYIF